MSGLCRVRVIEGFLGFQGSGRTQNAVNFWEEFLGWENGL